MPGVRKDLFMLRFTTRDALWLVALLIVAGAWWLDRSLLALNLSNCRFALEHQRQTIDELARRAESQKSK